MRTFRKLYMYDDAFNQLIYNDVHNTSLSHPLALWLSVNDLAVLAHVCRALRTWVVDSGKQCFLALQSRNAADPPALAPWKPHFLLNGIGAISKRHSIILQPRIYSCVGIDAEGARIVVHPQPGLRVDFIKSTIDAFLVNDTTGKRGECLGSFPMFFAIKSTKNDSAPRYDTKRVHLKVKDTLSSKHAFPVMFKLQLTAHVRLHDTTIEREYVYTSERFFVVSSPPLKGSANERARRDEPPKRSCTV